MGKRTAARRLEWVGRDIAGDADFDFRLFVKWFEVVVGDRPILERAPGRHAVEGFHPEILGHVAPGHGTVADRSAAHTRGVVVVSAIRRPDDLFTTFWVHEHTRFFFFVRTTTWTQDRGALVAQIVLAVLVRRDPAAAFEQNHVQARFRQFLGHHPAAGARANHHHVDMFQAHD